MSRIPLIVARSRVMNGADDEHNRPLPLASLAALPQIPRGADPPRHGGDVILPTIHMNGTSARDLLEGLCKAASSLRQAIRDLENAGPNGRDYYTQGPDAMAVAQREHQIRIDMLATVLADLNKISEHVADFA